MAQKESSLLLALAPLLATRLTLVLSNAAVLLEAFSQTVPASSRRRQPMAARHG